MSVEAEKKTGGNRGLYERQIALLDTFLAHGAISKTQHDKSRSDLTKLMFPDEVEK